MILYFISSKNVYRKTDIFTRGLILFSKTIKKPDLSKIEILTFIIALE